MEVEREERERKKKTEWLCTTFADMQLSYMFVVEAHNYFYKFCF